MSASGGLAATTELLEVRNQIVLIDIRESLGKAVGCGLQFGDVGGPGPLAAGGDVDAESFAAARESKTAPTIA